jgi:hypothetical protein
VASNYESSVALDHLAEVPEQLLPPKETNERHFRLLIAVLNYLNSVCVSIRLALDERQYQFEWDEINAAANVSKHSI